MLTQCSFRVFAVVLVFLSVYEKCLAEQADVASDTRPLPATQIDRSLVYKTLADGKELLADVYRPAEVGPHPTLLMIHGGAWFSGNKSHVAYHANYAAKHGYAVIAINYRLAPKYKYPAQLRDCESALDWIAEHADRYGFDKLRVGVYGYSAGAQLACMVGVSQNETLTRSPSSESGPSLSASTLAIRAIVAGGAPCEFSWIPNESTALAYWLGGSRDAEPEMYASASPVEFVDRSDPPVFLFHGTADRVVPMISPETMKRRLDKADVANELHLVERASHIGAFMDRVAREQAIRFLDQHLRD